MRFSKFVYNNRQAVALVVKFSKSYSYIYIILYHNFNFFSKTARRSLRHVSYELLVDLTIQSYFDAGLTERCFIWNPA